MELLVSALETNKNKYKRKKRNTIFLCLEIETNENMRLPVSQRRDIKKKEYITIVIHYSKTDDDVERLFMTALGIVM